MRNRIRMSQNLQTIVQNLISDEIDVPSITVNGLSINSKNTKAGDLFFAIPGTVSDGHDYINQSIDNGAVAVITNGRDLGQLPVPQIKVANPRRAASFIAAEFYNHPSKELTIIGITGTNGKTTTASIITSILRQAGFKTAQMGTLGLLAEGFPKDKNLTTENPISLHKRFSDLKKAGFTHVVMEVSSHALQQYRVTDVDFNYAIFTNLTPEHLDYHHTMEEYSYAKSKLFKGLALDATAIINMDDQFGEIIKSGCTCPVLSFSQSSKEDAHYSELGVEKKEDLRFNFSIAGELMPFTINPGFIITDKDFNIKITSTHKNIDVKSGKK